MRHRRDRRILAFVLGVILGFLFWAYQQANAQSTYYVDYVGGNNGNNGLSEGAAWKDLTNVNGTNFVSASTVRFKRGVTWPGQCFTFSALTDGRALTLTYYGVGNAPVFDNTLLLTDGSWTLYATNVYRYSTSPDPQRLYDDGVELCASDSDDPASVSSTKRWTYSGGYIYLYSTSAPTGIRKGNHYGSLVSTDNDYITFRGITFKGGHECFSLGNANYFTMDSCTAGEMGARIFFVTDCDYGVIKNSTLDRNDKIQAIGFMQRHTGTMDIVKINNGCHDWDIFNNVMNDPGHNCINLGADNVDDDVYNIRVYLNNMRNGGDYGRPFETHGAITETRDCLFYRNYLHHFYTTSQIQGRRNKFYYNLIDTVLEDLCNYDHVKWAGGFSFSDFETINNDSNYVENNTIRNCDGAGISAGYNAGDAFIRNNIVYNCGQKLVGTGAAYRIGIMLFGSNGTLPSNIRVVQNNVNRSGSADTLYGLGWHYWDDSDPDLGRYTLTQFQNFNSPPTRQFSNNRGDDPLLNANMSIPSNSPAVDVGLTLGYSVDYWGESVPYNSIVDIGADEYTLVPAEPDHLHWLVHPSNVYVNDIITPAMQIAVHDVNHNVVTSDTRVVTISLINGGGATMSGDDDNNCVEGVATFNDISISAPVTGCSIRASATGLANADSNPFNVYAQGAPTGIRWRALIRRNP